MIDALSVSTCLFGRETAERPFGAMLSLAAGAGYKYIEIAMGHGVSGRKAMVADAGLAVWSIHGGVGYDAASLDEGVRKAAVERERRRLEASAEFAGCPYVIHYVDRFNAREPGMQFCKTIEELYDIAHGLGIVLAIETAPYKPEENERYPDSAEIARFVRSFQQPDIGMTMDINHSNLNEDLDTAIANCAGIIANVHISDNHGQREEHLMPGKGIIDFAHTFSMLRQAGYQGPANLEYGDASCPLTLEELTAERKTAEALIFGR